MIKMKIYCILLAAKVIFSLLAVSIARTTSDQNQITKKRLDWKVILAGGLAGGIANAIIYPIDTIKTMRQSDQSLKSYGNVIETLKNSGLKSLYSGFLPAVFGAIPSSALYFGGYESSKRILNEKYGNKLNRPSIHVLSAATGNIVSSLVFVPKEAIKQQMQAFKTNSVQLPNSMVSSVEGVKKIGLGTVMQNLYKTKGIKGFYPSYRATLLRNIPSAMIRFTVYEELRLLTKTFMSPQLQSLGYLVSGTLSSSLASFLTTPFDVVKTRIATGVLPRGSKVFPSLVLIAKKEGFSGLFAGVQARLIWSGLFGGIGFTCFEKCKELLGVTEISIPTENDKLPRKTPIKLVKIPRLSPKI